MALTKVTYDLLEDRFTELSTISTTSGTINLDCSSNTAFNLSGNLGTATLKV